MEDKLLLLASKFNFVQGGGDDDDFLCYLLCLVVFAVAACSLLWLFLVLFHDFFCLFLTEVGLRSLVHVVGFETT